jgi:hypothetical protein
MTLYGSTFVLLVSCLCYNVLGFQGSFRVRSIACVSSSVRQMVAEASSEKDVEVPVEAMEKKDLGEIPSNLPSECGVDYVPLATLLATGDFEEADQLTRDNLIKIAGDEAQRRNFVYWTEARKLPSTDLATMERLWLQFSDGQYGYSIQKRVWDLEKGVFERFIRRIGWTKMENGEERLLKWFTTPKEFNYEPSSSPKGHLPLTSALRGTQLLKALMEHPVWEEYDWKNYKDLKWS